MPGTYSPPTVPKTRRTFDQYRGWGQTNPYPTAGTVTPTGFVSSGDPQYDYMTWLQQNFSGDTATGVNTQGRDPLRSTQTRAEAPPVARSSQAPFSATESSVTSQIPASQQAANTARASSNYTGNSERTQPGQGDAWDGFASRYAPGQRDLLFGPLGPQTILRDYLGQDGRTDYENMEGDLARYAAVAPEIYNLLIGGNMDPAANKDDQVINWMADLFKQQSTEGGRSPEVGQMLAQMLAGLQDEDSGLYTQTMIDEYGNPNNTTAQIKAIQELIPLLGTFSGNYNYTQNMVKQARMLGNEYAQRVANGNAAGQTFADYLKQHFLR